MRCVLAFILLTVAAHRPVAAEDGGELPVEIGKQAERDVGNAIGWFCDNPALINATLVTRNNTNYWVVTGVASGETRCRVGTDPSRTTFLFDITVRRAPPTQRL